MILWRISRRRDLSGSGGLKVPGRWHYSGQPIVYLAANPASALLEVCVHTSANDVPPQFVLLKIEGPELKVGSIRLEDLSPDWQRNQGATRDLGTAWLRKGKAALLRVPSAIVPETENYLFNPAHADAARFRVTESFAYPFDLRLKK